MLDRLVAELDERRAAIATPSLEDVAGRYLDVLGLAANVSWRVCWDRRGTLSPSGCRAAASARRCARAHRLLYESGVGGRTRWLGATAVKNPLDLWVFQEIIWETRPDVIVETGTFKGGSAFFLASICDLIGSGEVISIDIRRVGDDYPQHPRITYLGGRSATDPDVVSEIRRRAAGKRAMVLLDSDHSQTHVEAELAAYAPLVAEGCYLVVEDTNIGAVRSELLPGPMEAIDAFPGHDGRVRGRPGAREVPDHVQPPWLPAAGGAEPAVPRWPRR